MTTPGTPLRPLFARRRAERIDRRRPAPYDQALEVDLEPAAYPNPEPAACPTCGSSRPPAPGEADYCANCIATAPR